MKADEMAGKVRKIFIDSLFRENEDTKNYVEAEGLLTKIGFHPERLESHRDEVIELLEMLPDTFRKDGGGGWSFIKMPFTKDGEQWGEHKNADELLMLAVGLGLMQYLTTRDLWPYLPGGMPYVIIL